MRTRPLAAAAAAAADRLALVQLDRHEEELVRLDIPETYKVASNYLLLESLE